MITTTITIITTTTPTNQGGLSPANWTNNSIHPPSGWAGGFDPPSSSVYPGVRDAKAAIRWFRSNAQEFSLDVTHVGAGGWSAGACTTVHLASSFEVWR